MSQHRDISRINVSEQNVRLCKDIFCVFTWSMRSCWCSINCRRMRACIDEREKRDWENISTNIEYKKIYMRSERKCRTITKIIRLKCGRYTGAVWKWIYIIFTRETLSLLNFSVFVRCAGIWCCRINICSDMKFRNAQLTLSSFDMKMKKCMMFVVKKNCIQKKIVQKKG